MGVVRHEVSGLLLLLPPRPFEVRKPGEVLTTTRRRSESGSSCFMAKNSKPSLHLYFASEGSLSPSSSHPPVG